MQFKFYIADQDKNIQHMLAKVIQDHGFGQVVGYSEDGTKVVQEIIKVNPDVVLVDYSMPSVNFSEISATAKAQKVTATLILLISADQIAAQDVNTDNGYDYVIHKPIQNMEVISVVSKVCEKLQMSALLQSYKTTLLKQS